jgi:formate--tetrahydrofolate ligase
VELSEFGTQQFRNLYEDSIPLWEKVSTIAKSIYGASEIVADKIIREQFKSYESAGYGNFPICMAKTQYSFSTDPNLKGAPSGHVVQIRELRLSAGAEFIVVVTGEIMTMPGLPQTPAANSIELNGLGQISGLF